MSAYRFAEWLVWHWWRLRWEPSPSKPNGSLSWRQAHETTSIGGGWLWPHITFNGDGEFMTVGSQSSEATESEPVSYVGDQECQVRAKAFELGLDEFVNAVLGRLKAEGLGDNPLTDMWRELADERSEESATKYRRIEALLGCNPDEAPADVVNEHLETAKIIGDRAAEEIAAEPALRDSSILWLSPMNLRAWAHLAMARRDSPKRMTAMSVVQLESWVEDAAMPPWHHLGHALAHTVRESEHLGDGAIADNRLADVAGIRRTALQQPSGTDGQPPVSFIWASEEGRYASFHPRSRTERRFDAARLLGDTLCWCDDEPLRLATSTQTFRQKVQRAFAEELLCPTAPLVEMVGTDPSQPERQQAAAEFAVSPELVNTQLGKARQAHVAGAAQHPKALGRSIRRTRMPPKLWPLEPQTFGKHLVLRHYLDGWFPILGRWNGRLLFVDGFAGPGEYEGGEKGSPLVAMECVRRHRELGRLRGTEVVFLCMESDVRRADHLRQLLKSQEPMPDTTFDVLHGDFDGHMSRLLNLIDEQNATLAPSFVMVDPFGVKGSRMQLIGRVLANAKSECLISFMYEPIRRFKSLPEFGGPLDELFGTTSWRDCLDMDEEPEKKQFLHDLFARQLKRHGAKYVVPFELWRDNRHVYTLYFATSSLKGCNLMKASIWKVDDTGGYAFRSGVVGLSSLFALDTGPLARQLREEFGTNWTTMQRIDDFVMGDRTPYHAGQLRRDTLRPLERDGRIEVRRPSGGRGFNADKGVQIRFR